MGWAAGASCALGPTSSRAANLMVPLLPLPSLVRWNFFGPQTVALLPSLTARDDVSVITANPKTAGVARWIFFALWGVKLGKGKRAATQYVTKVGRGG